MAADNVQENVFKLGICMAGAVSAGAYTAGVMDYLLEALAAWEKMRGAAGVPSHKVEIPVMGGASAGGMTAIMTAAMLNNPHIPIDQPGTNLLQQHPENKLYHSWVDMTAEDMLAEQLGTGDITEGAVLSGLNAGFIDQIAARVIDVTGPAAELPAFIKPQLKLFTTLTNLEGFGYDALFNSDSRQTSDYNMLIHNDYACFEFAQEDTKEDDANGGWMPLNFRHGINQNVARDAAMATGAFPVGLKSRLLTRDTKYVNNNPWLKKYLERNPLKGPDYTSINADGGIINNEPFEKVRDVLNLETGEETAKQNDYKEFSSTVLMIEPFPTTRPTSIPPGQLPKYQHLLSTLGLTLPAVISQMRSKPVNVANAYDPKCAGQYLITPMRLLHNKKIRGEYAIACGALDGFSGFVNKEFRVHDYFLGRYNCKIFLRDYFTVPMEAITHNSIFSNGYSGIDISKFKSKKSDTYQIIPIFSGDDYHQFPDFKFKSGSNWPVLQDSDIDKYQRAIKSRVENLALNIKKLSWWQKTLTYLTLKCFLNKKIANAAIDQIKQELRDWQLLPKQTK